MLRESAEDHSAKLTAATVSLDQLSLQTLKVSDAEALRKFRQVAHHWVELAAAELAMRREER